MIGARAQSATPQARRLHPGTLSGVALVGAVHLGVHVRLALGVGVELAIGQIRDLRAHLRLGGGRNGEPALVVVVHHDRRTGRRRSARRGHPGVVGMAQQFVVYLRRGQDLAPGIAMSLRVHGGGVGLVDEAVPVDILDVVVHHVGDFAVAVGEVPGQAVVGWGSRHAAQRLVTAAQQRQLLVDQPEAVGPELVHEGEDGRRPGGQLAGGAQPDRRIQGVGIASLPTACRGRRCAR